MSQLKVRKYIIIENPKSKIISHPLKTKKNIIIILVIVNPIIRVFQILIMSHLKYIFFSPSSSPFKLFFIVDYIKHHILGYPIHLTNEIPPRIIADDPDPTSTTTTTLDDDQSRLVLRLNDFPYHLEENIHHYVLWSKSTLSEKDIHDIVQSKLPNHEYLYFINPPSKKTLPGIEHAHILARKKI